MNGVIYARYSCDKQTENSILGQVRECRLFAEREGINIINVYKDEAISGRTATKRPSFMKMIGDAEMHLFDCIIVWKGDRFSRSRADAAKYKTELKKLGVRVLSATEANLEGSEAILVDGINEAFAEYFSVELAEKVSRGMTQNALSGKFNGGVVPVGYKVENGKVLVDENTAPLVRELFETYASGEYNLPEILKIFNKKGYTFNGRELKKSAAYRMLQNERYYGHYEFKGTVNDTNMFPPIITKELWEKARDRAMLTHKNTAKYKAKEQYLLSGKLICGKCFTNMRGDSCTDKYGKKRFYYVCPAKREGKCTMERYPKEMLEDIVIDTVVKFLWDDKDIEYYVKELVKFAEDSINSEAKQLREMLADTKKKIENVTKAIELGADIEMLVPRLNELKGIKVEQEKALNRAILEGGVFDENTVRTFLNMLKVREYITPKDKKYLIETFIERIYLIDKKNIRIMFRFAGKNGEYETNIGFRFNSRSGHQYKK